MFFATTTKTPATQKRSRWEKTYKKLP